MHRLVINENNLRPRINQDGNRKWVTLIECIGIEKKSLPIITFKGKCQSDA